MKRLFIITALILTATVLGACHREVSQLTGDYSYKISGETAVTDADGEVSYLMVSKRGQMNILRDRNDKDKVLVTMNETAGGVYSFTATVKGDSLILDPYQFTTNILSEASINPFQEDNATLVFQIDASGSGFSNDDIIILNEQWSGRQSSGNATLSAPKMTMIAERN